MNSILFLFVVLMSGDVYVTKLGDFDTHKACMVGMEGVKRTVEAPPDSKHAMLVCAHNNAT